MTKINFVVGLTDANDYEGFIYDSLPKSESRDRTLYNIQRADTTIEKDSITWSLDLTLDATKNLIEVWKHIIQRPHLSMIDINASDNRVLKEHKDYTLYISFVNLIPNLPKYNIPLTADDYAKLTVHTNFGDIYLNTLSMNNAVGQPYNVTLQYAYDNKTTDTLADYVEMYTLPHFMFDFALVNRPHNNISNKQSKSLFYDWASENKDALTEKGYPIDMPHCNIGVLPVGKLIGDPWEEYQKLQKYNRVCRTSMVVEE